jgi:hypothetical protein
VRDTTGWSSRRSWYIQAHLDRRAEEILFDFLDELCDHVTRPVQTGVVTKLIERAARELNL